jgi:hypothetical protein
MSESTEPRAALLSPEDHGTIMALIAIQRDAIRFDKLNEAFAPTQEVLIRGGAVFTTHPRRTDGVQPLRTDYQPAAADHGPTGQAVPAHSVQPHEDGTTDTYSAERMGRGQKETWGTRDRRGAPTRVGRCDPGSPAIRRGSPRFENAVSQCLDAGNQSGPGGSPSSGRQRSEISRLPRLFRIRSNPIEKLNCSTPDGNKKQTCQRS